MFTFVLVIHIIISVILVLLVLLQAGKGAQLGAAFGGMGQNTVSTPETALQRMITYVAVLFFITSISLVYLSQGGITDSVIDDDQIKKIESEIKTEEAAKDKIPLETTAPATSEPVETQEEKPDNSN